MTLLEGLKGRLQATDDRLRRHGRYRIARNSILGMNQRDGPRMAAAMAYFAVFSIFPFILLLIALLGFVLDSESAQQQVISLLSDYLPAGATGVQSVIEGVIAARGVAAGFGILLLLWSALGWFEIIDRGVNEMWGIEYTRSFLKGKLFALAMITGIALVMLLSWTMNIAIEVVRTYAGVWGMNDLPGSVALWDLMAAGVSLALITLVFLLLYRFSPICDLSWGQVWRGALITAVIWEVVRSGFAIFVTNFANFSSVYGPIAAVIAFLVWLDIAHIVIVFGAQLTHVIWLEAQGIHELRDVPCDGRPAAEAGRGVERGRPTA